jgi:uncharacterized coiled-coil protein SlyX
LNDEGNCVTPINGEQGLLVKLIEETSATNAKVTALSDAMLGDQGHIKRIQQHLDRLYEKDRARREDIERLKQSLQTSAGTSKSFRDKIAGAKELVVFLVLLAGAVASGVEIAKALR